MERWKEHRKRCFRENFKIIDRIKKHERGRCLMCDGKLVLVPPEVPPARIFIYCNRHCGRLKVVSGFACSRRRCELRREQANDSTNCWMCFTCDSLTCSNCLVGKTLTH